MRVKSSLLNITAGLANQFIITALSFISRTVFITTLGIEYLGVNGLFTNILAMLTLAEAGLGVSIMYSLYKPVAENDHYRINILMKFYRNTYMVIAAFVLVLGLALVPFLDFFIKNAKVEDIHLIYLIFLLNTVAPYFYVHKNSFLNVSQKGYIVTGIYSISSIISVCIKIGILHYTQDYILYLIIESVITILNSIVLAVIVNRMYPYLKAKVKGKLDSQTKGEITKNVKAMVLQNTGNYLIFGTDNIIISSFVSVAAVGLYSNYNMLIEICRASVNQVFSNIYHSVGNLVASENTDKVYDIYKIYRLVNFWLYSFFTIILAIMLEPFISVWLGNEYLLNKGLVLVLMFIFFERGMRNSITTIKTTAGIFYEDRFVPIFQAIINLSFSIILVQKMGITGVFVGTLISALAVPFWTTPYLVFKKVFNKNVWLYYRVYANYVFILFVTFLITSTVANLVTTNGYLSLIFKVALCVFIPNIIYLIIFRKSSEFVYLWDVTKTLLAKLELRKLNKKMTYKV